MIEYSPESSPLIFRSSLNLPTNNGHFDRHHLRARRLGNSRLTRAMPYVYQLPTYPEHGGRKTQGFLSPVEDKSIQRASILPRRVLPIIFIWTPPVWQDVDELSNK
ncbi:MULTISPECIES: hypothetical protein [Ralstonia solanacearum species complex]|uniref:hypothetical protein n=1 Tax=Ralstonia solanacearum species complex TaxID=3116862 RepID=UPI000ADF5C17|nr:MULTISPECIES: hypothetical protein [Ralstonia solanacearum species complex]QWF63333.1 hypothetical protein KM864_24795 [Ralstonia solanacearum]